MSIKPISFLVFFALTFYSFGQTMVQPLAGAVNTSSDETAPFQYGGRIYFTSTQQQHLAANSVQRIFSTNGEVVSQFNINPKNAAAHAADLTLSSDAKRMYYTVCKGEDCEIWMRERNYEGDWSAARKLPHPINQRGGSCRQPTVGFDQGLKKDVLYFSAEKPGGTGGLDIWGSVIERDIETGEITYGMPFHLPINSVFDEVSPFFHMASQTLFFSSNGLPGLGGHDVFLVKKDENGAWTEAQNVGPSLNGPSDDLHYSYHTNSNKGYLSSNRGAGGDFDIYAVLPHTSYQLSVLDVHTERQLFEVAAEVFDEEIGRTFIYRQQPFDDYLNIPLQPEKKYRIAILADGYSPSLLVVETENQQVPVVVEQAVRLFREDVYLKGNREEVGKVFRKEASEKGGGALPVPTRSRPH